VLIAVIKLVVKAVAVTLYVFIANWLELLVDDIVIKGLGPIVVIIVPVVLVRTNCVPLIAVDKLNVAVEGML
jgi:hypothetical protein